MNIPETFLVEPYNAYAPKNRKKHWHEVIEEQALLARIIAEQQALQEAQTSRTLPPNSPNTAVQSVGNMNAGAGGNLVPQVFYPAAATVNFDRTPSSGVAPLSVQFSNLTTNSDLYTYLWTFSKASGVISTSTDTNPLVSFDYGADATDAITASLQATSSVSGVAAGVSPNVYTSASIPVITIAFTLGSPAQLTASFYTASAGAAVPFVNGSSINNGATLTYNWNFGSGSNSTSSVSNPTNTFTNAGTYTVVLGATGSYGLKAAATRKVQIIP